MRRISRLFRSRPSRLGNGSGDEGAALPMVIIMGFVLLTFVATATVMSVSALKRSGKDADWNGAMAAAYAAVEDYQSRLANDNAYPRYGNPSSPFSQASSSAVVLPSTANPALGVGPSGTWATVAGSDGRAQYRYEIDNSQYSKSGVLRLRATGKVGSQVRTVVVDLKQKGFIDFLYFTDLEIQDPVQSGVDLVAHPGCALYYWQGRPQDTSQGSVCGEIAFGSGDVTNGPAHSNDSIRVCDATFNGQVTTGWSRASGLPYLKKNSNNSDCSGQVFSVAGSPSTSKTMDMPPTNSEMQKEVYFDLVERPGCLYTGPTKITFNSDGTMTVRSPRTKFTQLHSTQPALSRNNPSQCGTPGTGTGQLGSASGQTIPVLDNNLIFVQDIPTTGDVNYSAPTCSSNGVYSNGVGYPVTDEQYPTINGLNRSADYYYNCRYGDVFVQGVVAGNMTIAADHFVYVTGNITYANPRTHMLGLVGNDSVWVWNPMKCTDWNTDKKGNRTCGATAKYLTDYHRSINAAILSVAHTFAVQHYYTGGDRGKLTVNGAIAQKFRGVVRSGSNGYVKNYNYDDRFRYMAPPKFLSPVSTTYGVSEIVEVKTAWKPDGSATT
jgi:hypothetical protein